MYRPEADGSNACSYLSGVLGPCRRCSAVRLLHGLCTQQSGRRVSNGTQVHSRCVAVDSCALPVRAFLPCAWRRCGMFGCRRSVAAFVPLFSPAFLYFLHCCTSVSESAALLPPNFPICDKTLGQTFCILLSAALTRLMLVEKNSSWPPFAQLHTSFAALHLCRCSWSSEIIRCCCTRGCISYGCSSTECRFVLGDQSHRYIMIISHMVAELQGGVESILDDMHDYLFLEKNLCIMLGLWAETTASSSLPVTRETPAGTEKTSRPTVFFYFYSLHVQSHCPSLLLHLCQRHLCASMHVSKHSHKSQRCVIVLVSF